MTGVGDYQKTGTPIIIVIHKSVQESDSSKLLLFFYWSIKILWSLLKHRFWFVIINYFSMISV